MAFLLFTFANNIVLYLFHVFSPFSKTSYIGHHRDEMGWIIDDHRMCLSLQVHYMHDSVVAQVYFLHTS